MANLSTITGNVLADSGTALTGLQPISASLTSISGLTYASTSFVKMSAAGTFALDTSTYTIGGVTGTGTTNYVPKFTSASVVGNSLIYDNGTNVGINTTTPRQKFEIVGDIALTTSAAIGGYYKQSVGATNDYLGLGYFNVASSNDWYPTAGVPALTIKYTGNVGIGTTSPKSTLQLGSAYPSILNFDTNNGSYFGSNFYYSGGWKRVVGSNASAISMQDGITTFKTSGWGASDSAITWTDGITMDVGGNVGIGTTTSYNSRLVVIPASNPTTSTGDNNQISIGEASGNAAYSLKLGYLYTGGTYVGSVQSVSANSGGTLALNASGGNVGIGTTSPSANLQVGIGYLATSWNAGGTYPIYNSYYTALAWNFTNGGGEVDLWNTQSGGSQRGFVFRQQTGASAYTALMTIQGGGNVGIGTTTPAYALDVNGTGRFSGALTGTSATFSSTVTATNFILSSDRNLKDNIAPISTESLNIDYKSFSLKSDPNQLRYGVIAQEVEVDYPELAYTDKEGVKSVAYIDLLIREIAALKERIIILEAK